MHYVILLVGLLSGEESEEDARYLCRLPEPSGGQGFLSTTPDPAGALSFETPNAAFEFWQAAPVSEFHAIIEVRHDTESSSEARSSDTVVVQLARARPN